jgi:hypothetical protein
MKDRTYVVQCRDPSTTYTSDKHNLSVVAGRAAKMKERSLDLQGRLRPNATLREGMSFWFSSILHQNESR